MLSAMVELTQGKTTFVDEFEVDLCIVQTKDKEIVIWLSKDAVQASFLIVKVKAVRDQDNSIERATIQAVRKALPKPSWRFSFIVPRSASSDRPLVCLTLSRESALDGISPRCEAFRLTKLSDDYSDKDKRNWSNYSSNTLTGCAHFIRWLNQKQKSDRGFSRKLLTSPRRIITSCTHNPALPLLDCIKLKAGTEISAEQKAITEGMAKKMEKLCPSPIIFFNPLFNTDFQYAGRKEAGEFRSAMMRGGAVTYEMHSAAKKNDEKKIEELFTSGFDLNLKDESGWAPLHYAAFDGNLKSLVALLHSGCDVNILNNRGSSALHLSIMGVQPFVVELLLLHPKINRSVVDSDGCTPLDLGKKKKQNSVGEELGKLLYLLEFLEESPKILVTFPDRTSAMMKMTKRKDTRADELLYEVLTVDTALKATTEKAKELMNFFSVWLICGEKAIQLEKNELPARLATVWEEMDGRNCSIEIRRNQMMTVEEEKRIKPNQTSQTMFVHEITQYFQDGWLDTSREDAIYMTVQLPPLMGSSVSDTLDRLPRRYKKLADKSADERHRLMREIERETSLLPPNLSYTERESKFLAKARKYTTYGSRPYSCIVDYIMPPFDSCGFLGVTEDGVHVYSFEQELFCSYSWDNFTFNSTRSHDGSTVIQFDQYAREVTFTALVQDPLIAASILRLCNHFSRRNRGLRR